MVSGSGEDPWGALEGGNPLAYTPGGEDGRDAVKAFVAAVLPALRAVRKDIEKGVNRHITERIAESQGNSASTSA